MFSNRLLMVISTLSPFPFPSMKTGRHSKGVTRLPQPRNDAKVRLIRMRMLRRLSMLAAVIVVAGTASAAPSREMEVREVERLRGLSFVHGCRERTIDCNQLRPL